MTCGAWTTCSKITCLSALELERFYTERWSAKHSSSTPQVAYLTARQQWQNFGVRHKFQQNLRCNTTIKASFPSFTRASLSIWCQDAANRSEIHRMHRNAMLAWICVRKTLLLQCSPLAKYRPACASLPYDRQGLWPWVTPTGCSTRSAFRS